jgi:hypothetical protein
VDVWVELAHHLEAERAQGWHVCMGQEIGDAIHVTADQRIRGLGQQIGSVPGVLRVDCQAAAGREMGVVRHLRSMTGYAWIGAYGRFQAAYR